MEWAQVGRRLWKLVWVELKVFVREPMGFVGSVGVPVALFIVLASVAGRRPVALSRVAPGFGQVLPSLSALVVAISAVMSLITIVSIYREGGVLKRLRATPLGPNVILTAHVVVKLILTAVTLVALWLAGRRFYPAGADAPFVSFGLAVLFATWSILSVGFVIASIVPTARLAQPIAALVLYPMIAVSGLFFPVSSLPAPVATIARALPLTASVSLLNGIWRGEGWVAHASDVAVLAVAFVVCMVVSSRIFKWE